MFISGEQNAGQNHNKNVANQFYENVAKFTYLGNNINKEILHALRN
jgi:hypothetical protein